jgi:hypothetical protein
VAGGLHHWHSVFNMKGSRLAFVAVIGALGLWGPAGALPGAAQAAVSDAEQVYFEATISKAGAMLSRPQALVKVGSKATLGLGRKNADGPRFSLRYVVDQPTDAEMTATVTGLVDGHEVATGTLHFTGAQAAAVTLDGGGYTWQVNAEPMSTELMIRRRAQRR